MATACGCGLPAFISVATFFENAAEEVDFFRGILISFLLS